MTLDQIQVLQTIIKMGSFRAASQELHRAQSAVSYAVKSLEEELGFQLFDRQLYRPQLTLEGKAFLKKAEELLQQFSELQDTAEFLKRGHEPVIRIAVSALWPLPLLISGLLEFKKNFALTEIKIIHDVLSIDEQLLEDRADIGLGVVFNEKDLLTTHELFPVKLIATCAAHHPLAQFKGKVPESELARHPQIIMSSTLPSTNRSGGIINPLNVISVQDYFTKKEFLSHGLGWGLMPEHLVKEDIKKKRLVPLAQKNFVSATHVARHSQKDLGPCGIFLWNYFSHGQKKQVK